MAVRTLYDGEVHVDYHTFTLEDAEDDWPEQDEAFAGQANGICGAAAPGCVYLVTGLYTGNVGVRVELHAQAPPLGDDRADVWEHGWEDVWEDVVEVTYTPTRPGATLTDGMGDPVCELDLEQRPYRLRYCAHGMDAGRQLDTRASGVPQVDRYLLQLWPLPPGAEPEPDRILRRTSADAASRHRDR